MIIGASVTAKVLLIDDVGYLHHGDHQLRFLRGTVAQGRLLGITPEDVVQFLEGGVLRLPFVEEGREVYPPLQQGPCRGQSPGHHLHRAGGEMKGEDATAGAEVLKGDLGMTRWMSIRGTPKVGLPLLIQVPMVQMDLELSENSRSKVKLSLNARGVGWRMAIKSKYVSLISLFPVSNEGCGRIGQNSREERMS